MKINRRFKKNQDDYPRKKPWDLQETVAGIYQEESEASLEGILCKFEEDVAFRIKDILRIYILREAGSIPGSGRSPGEGNDNLL